MMRDAVVFGEGGEQMPGWAGAGIGVVIFATAATLFFVPRVLQPAA